ncbi:hypothetical protein VE02_08279 [Pseudogymnoascus sp. 03VT05]|nr:hypothetical protein VE02_08279 [Pseudogymnoascus sp. 03VT05]
MDLKRTPLNKGWQFKQTTSLNGGAVSEFFPVSQFPTVAHIDLLHHGLIKDPYIDCNELETLWVNNANWTYRTSFLSPSTSTSARIALVFDGLDTIVSVFLNNRLVLESRNMHRAHHVDVTDALSKEGESNVLELRFSNAPEYGRSEMKRIGYKGNGTDVHFGGPERLFVRKAQYHWGWDWGPAVNTCGPWKDIWLETYTSRISEFLVRQQVSEDLQIAELRITGAVDGEGRSVLIHLTDPSGNVLVEKELPLSENNIFEGYLCLKKDLQLWYPFLYGQSPLYTISATLPGLDVQTRMIGLRRLKLLQHKLKEAPGTSFIFEINNIRVFSGGSCWIPGDFMLPRMTKERYTDWLMAAKSGNQSMIRVWGGGIVESDHFYDICDKEGILVWQDFLFACGDYPASPDFIAEVKTEGEGHIKRVGHHASLVLWAGNNEDYMLAERFGWEFDPADQEGPWDKTQFPAREIYERVQPELCQRLGGDVPYWRSSPYGGKTSNDVTVGDTHIWDIWHGKMSPYQDYKAYTSRFVSEFGFESAPDIRTLHKAITDPMERHWQSLTFDAHDKGPGHERRYPLYAGENFRFRLNPLADFIYCSQFLQAEAMSYAYNHWRREFRGPGEEYCSGVLVWQLNDIWPGTSWALVDVDLHRKPSFYITKRALAPIVLGMERVVTSAPPYITTGYRATKSALNIWAVNGFMTSCSAELHLSAWDIETGSKVLLPAEASERNVRLKPNQSNELATLEIPNAECTVIAARLVSDQGTQLARWVSWPEPLKLLRFKPDLIVSVEVESSSATDVVVLKADAPAKGVVISVPVEAGEDAEFADNFVDLVPGEEIRITAQGLAGRRVQARWLCDWERDGFQL